MRIFTAVLATETNTFSPICIDRRAFEASLYARPGEHPDSPTLCSAPLTVGRRYAHERGFTLIEGTAAWADPAGLVNRQAYEGLRDEILDQLRAAMPVDAVVMGLHGAMVANGYDDVEGDLLSRIREIVGPDVLIGAEFDPHSHLTRKRVAAADVLVGFKEFPHTDFVERAEDLWRIVLDALDGEVKPVMSVYDPRMIDVYPTSKQPMRGFVDRLYALEKDDPEVLSVTVVHGFMAGDVPEMGTKLLVITNDNKQKGDALAKSLGRELFDKRGQFIMAQDDVNAALDKAAAAPKGPVVIADVWDNPGGGTAGDSTVLLEAALERDMTDIAFGTIWDPIAVQICMAAGEGAEIPLRFGAKSAPGTGQPIDGLVKVVKVVPQAEQAFGASFVPIGDSAHIRIKGIDVILNSTRAQSFDPSVFSALGIAPTSRKILVIKSTNHFHAAFARIAAEIIYCSAGSPYPNDPATNAYRKAPKDIWPMVADPQGALVQDEPV
ncbi:M81 family metallopeptidase [Cucumibacter marinus]|uniref:M81 family metallopeptidase n=1 Tax=Cucumibacter marinus TaxID=1121252 RepID=UPI00048EDC27|nr:M81 family metallopeptidase [Cucumibacter marinus]